MGAIHALALPCIIAGLSANNNILYRNMALIREFAFNDRKRKNLIPNYPSALLTGGLTSKNVSNAFLFGRLTNCHVTTY